MNKTMRVLILSALLVVSAFSLFAQDGVDLKALLDSAESAFKMGNELLAEQPEKAKAAYLESLKAYNSIIESGVENPKLYYNAANAYLRLEQTGYAILYYKKALLYSPNDSQIRYNLNYARSIQKNDFNVKAESKILHIMFFWHYMLSPLWKIAIVIAANLVFWSALFLKRFGRQSVGLAAAVLVIALVFGASFIVELISSDELHGVVTAESTIGRLGDSRSYEAAFEAPLYQGVEFTVEQQRVGWILARLPNDELVWLEESDCGIVEGH